MQSTNARALDLQPYANRHNKGAYGKLIELKILTIVIGYIFLTWPLQTAANFGQSHSRGLCLSDHAWHIVHPLTVCTGGLLSQSGCRLQGLVLGKMAQ